MATKTPRTNRAAMSTATTSPHNRRSSVATSSDEGPTTANTHHWKENGIGFSPSSSSTPSSSSFAPAAVRLGEDEDDISPTSVASVSWSSPKSQYFSFASPTHKPTTTTNTVRTRTNFWSSSNQFTPRRKSFFTSTTTTYNNNSSSTPKQHGYLSDDKSLRWSSNTRTKALVLTVVLWTYGAWSWTQLWQNQNNNSSIMVPPPESPSALARAAFAKNFPHGDWGAAPSLWVVLEALPDPAHPSFTDDTSLLYFQGKNYHFGLTDHLTRTFGNNDNVEDEETTEAVRVTSYYSLQNQGLDYLAKNMVTPDGSKTMLQIQYLPEELALLHGHQEDYEQVLKQTILDYGRENPSARMKIHYTGVTWSSPTTSSSSTGCSITGVLLGLVLLSLGYVYALHHWGLEHPHTLWGMLALASMMSTVLMASIGLSHLSKHNSSTTPAALSTMVLMALVLSIYYSKIQVDSHVHYKTLGKPVIRASGGVLLATFASLYMMLPSPTLQSVGIAATWTIFISMVFHLGCVPFIWDQLPYAQSERDRVCPSPSLNKSRLLSTSSWGSTNNSNNNRTSSKSSSISLILCSSVLLFIALQARRIGPLTWDRAAPKDLFVQGNTMGHGRLTPYRILFDGHKSNISMISLNGYDIVQLVIDEIRGIALSSGRNNNDDASSGEDGEDTEDAFASDLSAFQGSTHVGEANAEVQHLIKDFVEMLRQFKERQQEEFDQHHRRRQEQLEHRKKQQPEDKNEEYDYLEHSRSDFKVNSGLSATTYAGISVLENSRIPQSLYSAAKVCRGMAGGCPSEALHLLNVLEDETTTSDHLATYVTVNLGLDPFSKKGAEWLQLARETIARLQEDPRVLGGVEVHIEGYAASVEDFKAYQNKALPGKVKLVIGIVLVALAICSRSILVPLRILLATTLTMAVALGLEVLIFKDGDSQQSLPVMLLTATIAAYALISETLELQRPPSSEKETESTLFAAGTTTVGSLVLLGLCFKGVFGDADSSLHVPLLLSVALTIDIFVTRSLLLPSLEQIVSSYRSKRSLDPKMGRAASCKNDDYLKKYEDFVQSPRAP